MRHHRQYHHHHRQQLPQLSQQLPQPPPQHVPTCRHRIRSPSAGAAESKESPSQVNNLLSVDQEEVGNDTDSSSNSNSNSNLCPNAHGSGRLVAAVGPDGFQSFPLDENSVYTHHLCSACTSVKLKGTSSDSQLIRNNRDASPHSASSRRRPGSLFYLFRTDEKISCLVSDLIKSLHLIFLRKSHSVYFFISITLKLECVSDVPKRTVSRLTNSELVNNNTPSSTSSSKQPQPSPSSTTSSNSSHHSSPQFSKSTRRPLQQPNQPHMHHQVRQGKLIKHIFYFFWKCWQSLLVLSLSIVVQLVKQTIRIPSSKTC